MRSLGALELTARVLSLGFWNQKPQPQNKCQVQVPQLENLKPENGNRVIPMHHDWHTHNQEQEHRAEPGWGPCSKGGVDCAICTPHMYHVYIWCTIVFSYHTCMNILYGMYDIYIGGYNWPTFQVRISVVTSNPHFVSECASKYVQSVRYKHRICNVHTQLCLS